MSDRSRQRLRTIIAILATAIFVAPAAALATHGFTDVDNSDFYHAAIDWMKDNGVTAGCNPPDNTRYCPDQPVTRGEMAVFLERLDSKDVFLRPGEGQGGDGVDGGDADTVDGKHAADFLGVNQQASDANTLDGKDSTAFLGAGEQAADADSLDGKDSSAFFQVGDSLNAETLDGQDSTAFLGATQQATDADKLDGNDSTAFLGAGDKAADADLLDGKSSQAFAAATDLADLDAFIPVVTFTVTQGGISAVQFRDPITGTPVISGADGEFTIDFPGWTWFSIGSDTALCSGLFSPYSVELASIPGGDLRVRLYESDGTPADDVDNEDDFSCAVYDS